MARRKKPKAPKFGIGHVSFILNPEQNHASISTVRRLLDAGIAPYETDDFGRRLCTEATIAALRPHIRSRAQPHA